jgi:redox-sensitive bicupin YhaK (pirin superfamily)
MSAGRGIVHSEKNDAVQTHTDPVHFIQMWVLPDEASVAPGYEQLEIAPERMAGGWATVASGMSRDAEDAAIRIRQRHAALHAARLRSGESVQLRAAPFVHLFVAVGAIELEGVGRLGPGDAARVTHAEGQRIAATEPAEVLAWEMHASLAA